MAHSPRQNIKQRMVTYIAAGLGLVAGLAWNDAIAGLIKYVVPDTGNGVIAKFLYAFLLTVIVATVLYYVEGSIAESEEKP